MNPQPNNSDNDLSDDSNKIKLPRRALLKAVGATAGAGMLGVGVAGTATSDEFVAKFADRRVREARKAWAKGFRGRPDRSLGILSDGLESRHPDIGPWNGIRAIPDGDEGIELIHENLEVLDNVPDDIRFFAESRPLPQNTGDRHEYPFTGPQDVHRMIASAKGDAFFSNGMKLLLETAEGEVIESHAGNEVPHTAISARIESGKDYIIAIENTIRSVRGNYYLKAMYYTEKPNGVTDPFANVNPKNITATTPKVIGWFNEDYNISNPHPEPWGGPHGGGEGEFLASIMTGSGRASAIDRSTLIKDQPNEVLFADEDIVYEIEADPSRGVFGVASGERIQVEIYGPDGNFLGHDHGSAKNRTHSIHHELTVHDTGTKTYEVHVGPKEQTHTFKATSEAPAQVHRVCVGAFKKPDTTAGDRTGEDPTLRAGIAPNAGLVGLSGWRKTREALEHLADDFARKFNLRVLNISLGFGNDFGIAGGKLSDGSIKSYKALAKAGVLTVSRTMETQPPAILDRAPAGADEAIYVANAGPWDGIMAKDSKGPIAIDEDGEGVYRKPDVTALGSRIVQEVHDYVVAALGTTSEDEGFRTEDELPPFREYGVWGQAAAQPPFVAGMAGLVAQAMEEEAPDGIALPPPKDAGFSDTMRLKQTILATASETPFTAAPWHDEEPTYDFGGHDSIEGWGRVNIDAAVEAVSRNLTPYNAISLRRKGGRKARSKGEEKRRSRACSQIDTKTSFKETVGLKIPRDSRAVAGYISGKPGVYKVEVDFSHYTGEDQELAVDPPHLDLFVYDAENPAQHGTPNIVAKAPGFTGSASVKFSAGQPTSSDSEGGTYYVVAKLLNVPGAHNSFDIQAQFSLSVEYIKSSSETKISRNTSVDTNK